MALNFPIQTIPEKDKTPAWHIDCVRYGLSLLDGRERGKDDRLYRSYNGIRSKESLLWITSSFGKESKAKFVSYKVGRAKQYLLEGEYLSRPLNVTVETININARREKMVKMDLLTGAMIAKEEISTLKQVAGVDVMQGVPLPQDEDDLRKMSPQDKQEDIMQIIVDEKIKTLGLKKRFSDCFKDARIVGRCFGKIEINYKGEVDFIRIDPRDSIFEEIDNDDYLEKSTIKGGRQWLPIHEVLMRYDLSDQDRKTLENCRDNPVRGFRSQMMNGHRMVEVVHLEWKSVRPSYYKIMPKTSNQLEYDSETTTITNKIPPEIYEANKAKYDKGVAAGEFQIDVKYDEDLREGTSLGRLVFVELQRKPFQMRRHDAPASILDSSYVGALFGTTDGQRIPLQELIENFDLQYDYCEYQIMKELGRAKGRALIYDLAGTPKKTTVEKIMQQITDDGFATFNSSAAGNVFNRNLDLQNVIKHVDLGFSEGFPQLLQLQNHILSNLDRITGINDLREGAVPASSTVTNAQQGLQNSRTITEPLFFQMQEFVERCMLRIVEASKISYAFYKTDQGEQILGTDKFNYMRVTQELGYRDYGVHIEDGAKYTRLREKMDRWMEYGLNSKQVSMADAAKYELAETTAEAKAIFEQGFERIQQISAQQQQQQHQAEAQQQQQALQMQQQMASQARQETIQGKVTEIKVKTQGQIEIDDNKMRGGLITNQHSFDNENLQNSIPTP